ncbi:zinc finger domain-containing protein [Aeropyrum pernix]|uniref:zinc finger domain-containing protein n=1 Tax=Aeropyrum pernix TaxID=56636 RepID=UPI001037AFF0|nr:zinc finger domain-containing protein [Aeropyrum pernix]
MAVQPRKIDVYDYVHPPRCTTCGRIVEPSSTATRFPCPNCGEVEIWRCSRCRKQGATYTCPNCGFTGP